MTYDEHVPRRIAVSFAAAIFFMMAIVASIVVSEYFEDDIVTISGRDC
jgi:hypothetical protein